MRHPKRMIQKAKQCKVRVVDDYNYLFVVKSPSGKEYDVRLGAIAQCTCDWSNYHRYGVCSHVLAVEMFLHPSRTISAWATEKDAKRQHRKTTNLGDGVWMTARKKA